MTAAPPIVECAGEPCHRGRPRDGRIDLEITSAALAALADHGFDRFTVEDVAHRAGVAKTTVYRRFPTRDDLILGALERLNDDLPAEPVSGPVREQLIAVLSRIRRRTPDSVRGRILTQAVAGAGRDPGLAELVHERVLVPRQEMLRGVIRAGMASGELRDDLDLDAVIPVLVGPMLHLGMWQVCASAQSVSVEAVVDMLLTGLTPASGS
jgi:AcrR family transcriptional regulator